MDTMIAMVGGTAHLVADVLGPDDEGCAVTTRCSERGFTVADDILFVTGTGSIALCEGCEAAAQEGTVPA